MKKQNNTAMAHSAKPHKKRPFRLLALMAMMALAPALWAQTPTWQTYPSNVGNLNEWNYETNGTYKITSEKTIASTINLNGNLTLYPVGVQTIKVGKDVSLYALGCKNHSLYIIGTDNGNNKIIFDGGANNRADGFPNPTKVNEGYTKAAIYCNSWGNMWLQNVVFQHFATDAGQNGGNHYCGVINLTNYESNPAVTNTLSGYFKNVEIKECFGGDYKLESLDDSYRYGRIISIIIGKVNLFMDNVNIHHCLIHEDLEKGHFIVNDPISGFGGIIRSQGNSSGKLEMQNCKFRDNQYRDLNAHTPAEYWNNTYKVEDQPLAGQGGAINWRSGASYKNQGNDAWLSPELIIRNCTFERNCAKQGGAIATCCKTSFVKNGTSNYTYISKNHAEYGGGLFFWSYNDGQKTYNGDGFDVTLGGEGFNDNNSAYVRVFDNFALYSGGGAYITIDPSDDVGFEPYPNDAKPKATAYNATFGTGCEIRNNRAPQGAGVTIIDNAAMRHRGYRSTTPNLSNGGQEANPVLNKWSGILSRTITFDGAIVKDNYTSAQGTFPGSEAAGAGFYIVKQKSKDSNFANDFTTGTHYDTITTLPPGGLMTVNVMSGVIQNNHARQYKLTIGNLNQSSYSPFTDTEETTNPKPGKGGGFYIASLYDIADFKSALNVNIGKVGASDDGLQVFNNDAYTDGGGLYIYYDRDNNRDNGGDVKVLNGYIGKTSSETNKALNGNGGGLCVLGGTVTVGGGHVVYNTAAKGYGGGIYVNVPTNNSVTYINASTSNNTKGTNISYNSALGGGGVYVDKGKLELDGPAFASGTYGETEAGADNTHTRLTNNEATDGNGGGIDAGNGTVEITNTLLYKNTASGIGDNKGRGGGVYLDGGTIKINTSKILFNTAYLNGGGIDDHFGSISITGGDISNNTAINGGGGGVYTHHGNITVWPDYDIENTTIISQQIETEVMPKGTKVDSNKAGKNGGGLNTHVGRFDVRFATITNNEAGMSYGPTGNGGGTGGNGGGLFCEGPHTDPSGYTVRLLHCHLNDNKVYGNVLLGDGISGRGGGIYLKKGSIFAEHCDILRNEADINGGGLDNHEGELRVYGSYIDHNKAKTGRGGGIYTEKGNIVVGPCDSYGFTASKASRILYNTAYINGGGINNHEGNITIHGDRINNNTAETGDGGGVYIKSGQILMYGGQINENKADQGKGGGVYGGSGKFNIMEREPHPILEILEMEKVIPGSFTVHFHHVDRGLAMETGAENKEFGIAYSTNEYPDLPENQEWTTTNWPGVTKITFTVADGESDEIDTDYQGVYSYVRNEGCSRVTVNGLSAGTYYVVAYGKYSKGTKNYFDASPALKVVIPSSGKAAEGNHPKSIYPAVEENPFFMELTPLQQAIMVSTPEADSTTVAPARQSRDDEGPVDIPQINKNTARYGGGICIDKQGAELIFAGSREANPDEWGQINKNYASEAGGGIYIGYQTEGENPGPAMMQMMGKCEVNRNRVPAGKHGGGIYLDGRLYVGDQDTDTIGTHGLKVDKNFAIDKDQDTFETELDAVIAGTATDEVKAQYGKKTMNNVFLPRNEYDYYQHHDGASSDTYNKVSVITLLSDVSGYAGPGDTNPYSHIGFSVVNGFCPVIATAEEFGGNYNVHRYNDAKVGDTVSEMWLYHLMSMNTVQTDGFVEGLKGAVFEDSESYVAIHTRIAGDGLPPFRSKYIYLWGCWTHPIVMNDPESEQPMKGSSNTSEPHKDPKWKGHYVITNPGDNTADGSGDPLVWEIYSPEGLSWFTSYVNGLNAFDEKTGNDNDNTIDPVTGEKDNHHKWYANKNPKAIAKIMNDLDMSAYLWVPIGSVQKFYLTALSGEEEGSLFVDSESQVMIGSEADTDYTTNAHYYQGTFDGQGHIIKGLQGLYLTGIRKFGLFGYLTDDAVVKNTFVDEGLFVSDDKTAVYSAGGITGTMKLKDSGTAPTISNSEARMNFNAYYSADGTHVGGIVGDLQAGHVHSCMAMPSITTSEEGVGSTGQFVGGLVGKMATGTSVRNSFANVFFFTKDPKYKVGGIVSENHGTIENVYVRYNNADNTPDLPNDKFYWISGTNPGGTIKFAFAPKGKIGGGTNQWWYGSQGNQAQFRRTYQPTNLVSDKYGFAHDDQKAEAFNIDSDGTEFIPMENGNPLSRMTYDATTHETYFNGLVGALNNWVEAVNDTSAVKYTPWTRTMASTINDDYPVLMFNDFNVVGTEDGIYMKYDDNVNDMWKKPNYDSLAIADRTGKNFQNLTAALNPKTAMYLYKTNPTAINVTENTAVPLHIHQNVGVLQEEGKNLTARVGVTFDNSDGTTANGGMPYDWHMFSSALKAAPLGITYQSDVTEGELGGKVYEIYNKRTYLSQYGITHTNYGKRDYMDPPVIIWNTTPGTIGYFPTNTPYGKWGNSHWPSSGDFSDDSFDFYCLDEPSRHWINFKREGSANFMDHWHQDIDASGNHKNLKYMNEDTLRVGKGYMMGVSKTSMLMADGILNNGTFESEQAVTSTPYNFNMSGYSEELRGFNLVGNPYQSYLDFDALIYENGDNIQGRSYYLFDADAGRYLCYPADASDNIKVNAPQYLHPHQGFLVKTANSSYKIAFNNAMRAAEPGTGSYFRSERLNYPLVNLFCHDAAGFYDVTTVEMNRPQLGGGVKLKETRNGNSLIYARLENEDYQTLFAPTGTSTVPVRFEPSQNGVYTLRWETMHGDFSHLHLIDNLTGADIDLLNQTEYRFEGKVGDYVSRFKLVFEVTDIEEHEQESQTNFAFQFGDELVVNGGGELSVFDVQGRHIMTRSLTGAQSSISLPRTAAGLYILRLAGDKQVKIQKLIIK